MPRRAARLATAAAWALLGGLAALGLALSALAALSASPAGRTAAAALVARQLDGAFAGRLTLEGLEVLAGGGVEVVGLRLLDPHGHAVLVVPRARLRVDLTRLARRQVGFVAELESPTLLLDSEPEGLSLVRALASPRAAPPAPSGAPRDGPRWALGRARLVARGGEVTWRLQDGRTAVGVKALDLDAERGFDGDGAFVALRLRAAAVAPVAGPLEIDGAARLRGDRLEVPLLDVALGGTTLEAFGAGDLRAGTFRAAVTRLGVAAADARRLAPAAALGGDVAGTGYAESAGAIATAALEVPPPGGPAPGGTARAAVAVRLAATRAAAGFDVALAAFDPSRLLAQAPPGRLDLTARGAAAGRGRSDGRARLALDVRPSRLRGGALGPIALTARAGGGAVEVERLDARLPGLAVTGRGRWQRGGPAEGVLAVDASDLRRMRREVTALTGLPLPPLEGRLRVRATLAGSGASAAILARLDAPRLGLGGARAEEVVLSLDLSGPVAPARARLTGRAARVQAGATDVRGLELAATLADGAARFSLTGSVPALGPDAVALEGSARLAGDRRTAEVGALSLRWPGARFALVRPARVTLAPLAVDRLEVADGARSVTVSGGLGPGDALDLRLQVTRLDLGALARAALPPEAGLRGELSLDARAGGTVRAPTLTAHLDVTDGAVRGLAGLHALGDLRWDGAGRLRADVGLLRGAGGAVEIAADVPLPLPAGRARGREPVALTIEATGWPVEALRAAAGVAAPATGTLGGRVALSGTAAAPHLTVALTLDDATVTGIGPLAAAVALEGAGGALRIAAATRLAGAPLVELDARVPLDVVALLEAPGATLRGLARAPLAGSLAVPGLELAAVSGKAGLPEGLAGKLSGGAELGGTPSAPRGRGTLAVDGAAAAGYRDLAVRLEVTAEPERTAFAARATLGGAEALRADGALGLAVEGLGDLAARRAAPVTLEVVVPPVALPRAEGAALPLSGTLSGRASLKGTLAAPEARLELSGREVEVEGRPLGDFTAVLRHDAPTSAAEVSLRPTAGGTLRADAKLVAPGGLAEPAALREATATLRVTSDGLDLGFLPALAPGVVRSASGRLSVDLAASGPVAGLRPRGTVRIEGGRFALVGLGEWSDVELATSLGDRAIEVSRLEARHGAGSLSGQLAVDDLGTRRARLRGRLALRQLKLAREGTELATLDLPVELEGTVTDELLDATVTLADGTIRLPRKASAALQSLEERKDIVEVDAPERARRPARTAASGPGAPDRPFAARCRVVVPGRLHVKGERPAVNLELKGDSTWRVAAGELTADGSVEVVRGTVEPLVGRVFHVERGRVAFFGAGVGAGQLDVVARYDNPAAVVTVTIGGTVAKPSLQLSSSPAMDDAAIAMLIATGRTETSMNTTAVGTLDAQEAGAAVASAAVGAALTGVFAGKLPVDQFSVDTSWFRAGKYVTDKIFVGYAYHFDAKQEEGENANEVKAEYKISPRWNFEVRYGDAPAGNASLVWSKDY